MNENRLYQRLFMNKKGPIPEVVDEKKTPMPKVNLWYRSLFIHSRPLE
jgi:hypothetical protein